MTPFARRPAAPDAPMRVAAAAIVPAVGIAGHGMASGMMPSSAGILLTLAIGVAVGTVWRPRRECAALPAVAATAGLLTVAQAGVHLALSLGGHGGHSNSMMAAAMPHSPVSMMLTHLVAIPLSAVLIVLGALFIDLITSTIAAIVAPARSAVWPHEKRTWHTPLLTTEMVFGGTGLRGPPQTV